MEISLEEEFGEKKKWKFTCSSKHLFAWPGTGAGDVILGLGSLAAWRA